MLLEGSTSRQLPYTFISSLRFDRTITVTVITIVIITVRLIEIQFNFIASL